MFRCEETGEFMYPIEGYEPYAISRTGVVGRSRRVTGDSNPIQVFDLIQPIFKGGLNYIRLYRNGDSSKERDWLSVTQLCINSIYGRIPFNPIWKDGNKLNNEKSNLYVKYNDIRIKNDITLIIKRKPVICDKVLLVGDNTTYNYKEPKVLALRPIPENILEGNNFRYWVSSKGAVFDTDRNVFLSRSNESRGYYKVAVYINNIQKILPIHRITYGTWIDSDLEGWTIDHINGKRHDNDIDNLEKVSFQENVSRAHDRNLEDKNVIRAKWSFNEIDTTCKLLEKITPYKEIMKVLNMPDEEYNSFASLAHSIRSKRAHQDIACRYNIPAIGEGYERAGVVGTSKYSDELIISVMYELIKGSKVKDIVELHNNEISKDSVTAINVGRVGKHLYSKVPEFVKFMEDRTKAEQIKFEHILDIANEISKGVAPSTLRDRYDDINYSLVKNIITGNAPEKVFEILPEYKTFIENKRNNKR